MSDKTEALARALLPGAFAPTGDALDRAFVKCQAESILADPGPLLEALAEAGVLRREWSTVVGFTGKRGPETLEPLTIDPEVQTQDTRYVTEWEPTDARP